VTAKTATFVLTSDLTIQDPKTGKIVSGDQNSKEPPKRGTGSRTVDIADLATTHRLLHYFQIGKTDYFSDSIPLSASNEVINQLRSGQLSELDLQIDPESILNAQFQGHAQGIEVQIQWNGHFMCKCNLQRVEPTDLSFPVLVNGAHMELPAIHAKCPQAGTMMPTSICLTSLPTDLYLPASSLPSIRVRSSSRSSTRWMPAQPGGWRRR
jgi:hypothetical protein